MPNRIAVPSSDFIRNVGRWQDEALRQPIYITHHGRERLVLAAFEVFTSTSSPDDTREDGASRALRAALDAILENMSEGFIAVDTSLQVLSCNGAAAMMVGRTREDVRGSPVGSLWSDMFSRVLVDRLRRSIRLSKVETFESAAIEGRHVTVRVFPMTTGAAFFIQNVTELMRLSREHEALAAMKAALNVSQAAMISLDGAGRVSEVDENFAQWTAFEPARIVGHRFVDVVSAEDRPKVTAMLARTVTTGVAECGVMRLLGPNGDAIAFSIGVAGVFSEFAPRGHCLMFQRYDPSKMS